MATASAAKKSAPAKDAKPKVTVGLVDAREAIMAGKTNEQALDAVMKRFPDANTSLASMNWYRSDLRKQGKKVPAVARATKPKADKKAKPAAKPAAKAAAKPAAKPTLAVKAPTKAPAFVAKKADDKEGG